MNVPTDVFQQFQFLIGKLKTITADALVRGPSVVSIPHRKAKDVFEPDAVPDPEPVSIPHRKAKDP